MHFLFFKKILKDFPGGPGVETLPFSMGGGGGCWFNPGQGIGIPHTVRQLSPHATAGEKPGHHNQDWMQPNK